ncbi:MAG TPA: glycosyl hydrolase family 65 protein, partial [Chroococcales cyanobacterium]
KVSLLPEELSSWQAAATKMYTGLDPETGLFEQFRGYFELEDLDPVGYREAGLPIDVLLGRERIQRSKVNKQADVLMLFFLFWDRYPAEVREKNFRYYEPKTAHGSSLSPPVHALLAARLGDLPLFERYFRQTAEIDLSRDFGNAAGGVHMGALGGLWQAVVFGLGGFSPQEKGLSFEPRLPGGWKNLALPLQWRGRHLRAKILPEAAEVLLVQGERCSVAIGEEKSLLSAGERCRKGELDEG